MAKLVILSQGVLENEINLEDEVMIGRDPQCAVYLNEASVSRNHARLSKVYTDYILEDLGSTNGTVLNGRRVRKHVLRHGDVVQVGKHELRYIDLNTTGDGADLDKTVVIAPKRPEKAPEPEPAAEVVEPAEQAARDRVLIRFVRGPKTGTTKELDKNLFTIGKPGGAVAVITRRPQGYFLLYLGGQTFPKINNQPVQRGGVRISDGDFIEVGEHQARVIFGQAAEAS